MEADASARQGVRRARGESVHRLAGVDLRIFTEPQQGATYDQLLAVARPAEELGFDAFFRSDHYLQWATARAARPDRRLDHARRPGPRHRAHPARHAGHRRRRSGCPGRSRSRSPQVDADVRRPGRARPRRRLVRGEHSAYGIPFPPLGSASTGSRSSWPSSPGCGRRRSASVLVRRQALPVTDSPALPKPVQRRGRRSSSAARPARAPRSPPATPTSSTSASLRSRTSRTPFERVRWACSEDGPGPGVPDLLGRPGRPAAARTTRRSRPRRARPARTSAELRDKRPAGQPERVRRPAGRYAEAGRRPVYLQIYDLDDLG